jgi:hypothetical protein
MATPVGDLFIENTKIQCKALKQTIERALAQVNDEEFFRKPGAESHSIAVLVKHVGGTLRSRFTNYLTEEGEKPDRDRENEFHILEGENRAILMGKWEEGWGRLLRTLDELRGDDLTRDVLVRWKKQPALEGIYQQVLHAAQHGGQIIYLSKLYKGHEWRYLTIPPGKSEEFNEQKRREAGIIR